MAFHPGNGDHGAAGKGGDGDGFWLGAFVIRTAVEGSLQAAVVGVVALWVAGEELGLQWKVGNEAHRVVGFLFPKGKSAGAHANELVDVRVRRGGREDRAVERLVSEDIQASEIVVNDGRSETGSQAIHGVGGRDSLDVSVIDAGIALIGADDVGVSPSGPSGKGVRHGETKAGVGHVEEVVVIGGVDGDRLLAEAGDVRPGVVSKIEHGNGIVFLKADEELGIVRAEGDVFRLDVEVLGLGVVGIERGVIAQAADHARNAAEVGGGHWEGGEGRGEGVLIQAGQVSDSDGAGLLDAVEGKDVDAGAGPGMLRFIGDGDLTVFNSDHVRMVTSGDGADDGTGFEIEEYQATELRDLRGVVGAADVDGGAIDCSGNADARTIGGKSHAGHVAINEAADWIRGEPCCDIDGCVVGESSTVVAIQADATGGVIGDGEGVLRGRERNNFARADGHGNDLMLT